MEDKDQCSEVFKQKAAENFKASASLYDENLFNAASNRIYYCLIHAALSKAFKIGASEDLYTVINFKGKKIISKGKIEGNINAFGINKRKEFKLYLHHAKTVRIKSDYLNVSVIKEDFEQNIIDKLREILIGEGVLI